MLKATKKSISLLQSKCPLIRTIDCIIQSYSMPLQLLRTGCFQGLILTSWSSLNIIKPIMTLDANRLDLSFSGSYPVKVSSLRDFEVLSRDMIRILSQAEIF